MSTTQDRHRLVNIYVNDHLMGATAGAALASRAASGWAGEGADELREVAEEIADDRSSLIEIMKRCDLRIDHVKVLQGQLAEKAGRLKLNARLWSRSPLSSVEEAELLRLGTLGKAAGWRTLQLLADDYPQLVAGEFDVLIARAERQADILERLRVSAIRDLLADHRS